jgi:hypothetical protein
MAEFREYVSLIWRVNSRMNFNDFYPNQRNMGVIIEFDEGYVLVISIRGTSG